MKSSKHSKLQPYRQPDLSLLAAVKWARFLTRGHHPLLYVDSVTISHRDLFHRCLNLPQPKHWVRHSGALYVDSIQMERTFASIQKKLYTNWPKEVMRKMKRDLEKLNHYAQLAPSHPTVPILKKAFDLMYPAWLSTYFPIMIGRVIEDEVTRRICFMPVSLQKEIGNLMNSPLYPTVQSNYQKALRAVKEKKLTINKLMQRFGWIRGFMMNVAPLTTKQIRRDLRNLTADKQPSPVRVGAKLDSQLQYLIKLGRLYCWFRDWRLYELGKFYYFAQTLLRQRGQELGLTYNQLKQLTVEELLTGNFRRTDIKSRQKEFTALLIERSISVVTDRRLTRVKSLVRERLSNKKEVRGVVANAGTAIGRVKLVDSYSFSKVRTGDIVVAAETQPAAAAYLRGVKAIVTDEGGITSHAAIIARELKVPCVIGTKVATKVFKTGDRVEVDANKGIVKKL